MQQLSFWFLCQLETFLLSTTFENMATFKYQYLCYLKLHQYFIQKLHIFSKCYVWRTNIHSFALIHILKLKSQISSKSKILALGRRCLELSQLWYTLFVLLRVIILDYSLYLAYSCMDNKVMSGQQSNTI